MLEIKHLYKKYDSFLAVNDLNLTIGESEIFGFVGHNGAGKTTTMKIIAGLLDATEGQILIDGENAFADPVKLKRKIGYVPDFFGVYDNLKTIEYLEFYASMYGINGKEARSVCNDLLELVNLSDVADRFVDNLSRGMKQRLCLARALVHNPEILILDEPASGLDPRARYEMKEILKNLRSMGKTIIISSHILPELADMCDTIGIIQKGHLIMKGTVDDIQMKAMHARPLHIHVLGNQENAIPLIKEDPFTKRLSIEENGLTADYTGDDIEAAQLLKRLVTADIMVESFYREKGNLETLFLELTDPAAMQKAEAERNPYETEMYSGASPAGNTSVVSGPAGSAFIGSGLGENPSVGSNPGIGNAKNAENYSGTGYDTGTGDDQNTGEAYAAGTDAGNPYSENSGQQNPYRQNPYQQDPYGESAGQQNPYQQNPYNPYRENPYRRSRQQNQQKTQTKQKKGLFGRKGGEDK